MTKTEAVKLILRTKHGGGLTPPAPAPAPLYADVPTDHDDADWIYTAQDQGITTGCGDGSNFCPDEVQTRAGFDGMLDRVF